MRWTSSAACPPHFTLVSAFDSQLSSPREVASSLFWLSYSYEQMFRRPMPSTKQSIVGFEL